MYSDVDQIWKDVEKIFSEDLYEYKYKCENETSDLCKHSKKFMDDKEKSEICQDCGVVFNTSIFVF